MNPEKINVILHPLLLLIFGLLCCVPRLVSAKIVFCADGDIFVSDDDGSRRRRLTDSRQVTHRYPCWSPDGTKIAFTRYMDSTQRQTTGEVFIIKFYGLETPCFSGGRKIRPRELDQTLEKRVDFFLTKSAKNVILFLSRGEDLLPAHTKCSLLAHRL